MDEKGRVFVPLHVAVAFKSTEQRSGRKLNPNITSLILDMTTYNYPAAREWIKQNRRLAEIAARDGFIVEE